VTPEAVVYHQSQMEFIDRVRTRCLADSVVIPKPEVTPMYTVLSFTEGA